MKNRLLTLLALLLLTATLQAEIYKCPQGNGSLLYSNQPCGGDMPSVPLTIREPVINEKSWWERIEDSLESLFSSDNESGRAESRQRESAFLCQGKTRCSQMLSCEEAMFYLKNCPGAKIDGDGDGVPCERQWCN